MYNNSQNMRKQLYVNEMCIQFIVAMVKMVVKVGFELCVNSIGYFLNGFICYCNSSIIDESSRVMSNSVLGRNQGFCHSRYYFELIFVVYAMEDHV